MPYPSENPTAKHDLIVASNELLPTSEAKLIKTLLKAPQEGPSGDPKQKQQRIVIYSYENPCFLSRTITLVGRIQVDKQRLEEMLWRASNQSGDSTFKPNTIAVKQHNHKLPERDQSNSQQFAALMRQLRSNGEIALLPKDKHGRLGFLVPDTDHNENDYSATCYTGDKAAMLALISNLKKRKAIANNPTSIDVPSKKPKQMDEVEPKPKQHKQSHYHEDPIAAAIADHYDGLSRDLATRGQSNLFHMRNFNGWVKSVQIEETPRTMAPHRRDRMRVLDLACGKGGDLGKWAFHPRFRVERYVGVDVARGSLQEAARRAQNYPPNRLPRCSFVCADLGSDVLGGGQPLLTWSLGSDGPRATITPQERLVAGGGVAPTDKFDVVSIQFAIHYMLSSPERAKRFFRTVSELLEVGGELVATTIDAAVIVEHLMNQGGDLFFDSGSDDNEGGDDFVIRVGGGACRLGFKRDVVRRLFQALNKEDNSGKVCDRNDLYGLEYTFLLVEGTDHAAGVGHAVDLPEWLTPLPLLASLAHDAGLELVSKENFHEFYHGRKDPRQFPRAHQALEKMNVLNAKNSISADEWEISRLYCALKFRKVRQI